MRSRYTQAIVFIAVILVACNSFAQSPLGGLLNSIKNTSGYTIYRGQVVIADSTDVSLVPPFWTKDASATTLVAGSAVRCTTRDKYVDCGSTTNDSIRPTDSVSVSLWMYPTSSGYIYQGVFALNYPGQYSGYIIFMNGTTVQWALGSGGGWNLLGTYAPSLNNWHHVVGTFNSVNTQRMKIYVDGVLRDSATTPNSIHYYASEYLYIGRYYSSSYNYWGYVDEIATFHATLTPAEVATYYNGGVGYYFTGAERGFKMGFHLDENTGTDTYSFGVLDTGVLSNANQWVPGKVGTSSSGGGSVLYSIGTVYNDSILNGDYGFITTVGRGYAAVKNGKTVSVKPGDRVLVTCDSIGLADCEKTTSVTDHYREIGQPLTKLYAKNAHGDSICIADIHKL